MCFLRLLLTAAPTVGFAGSYSVCKSRDTMLPLGFPCAAVNQLLLPLAPLSQVGVISGADRVLTQGSVVPFVFVRGRGIIAQGAEKKQESLSLEKSFKITKCNHEIRRESLFFPSLHTSAFKRLISVMGRVWVCDSSSWHKSIEYLFELDGFGVTGRGVYGVS